MGTTSTLTTRIGIVAQHTSAGTSDNLLFIAIPIIVAMIALALCPFAVKRIRSNHGINVIEVSKVTIVCIVSVIVAALCILFFIGNAQTAIAGNGNISINDHIDLVLDEDSEVASADAIITNGTSEIYGLDTIRVISNNESIGDDLWSIKIVEQDYDIYDGNADSKNNIANVLQPNQSATIRISLQLDGDEENIFGGNIASLEIATKPTKMSVYYTKGNDILSNNINFNFDFAEFENADNTVVNRKLATVASLLSTKMYGDEQIVVEGQAYDMTNKIALEKALGFEDNYYYRMYDGAKQSDEGVDVVIPEISTVDNCDTTSYEFAHKKIFFGDHYSEIVSVNIAGTQCNNEWISNLDFGADTPNYYTATKEHPLWIEKDNHKGFEVAANRVEYALNDYLNKYVDNDANTNRIIFITGHSRGAGIANIVGKDFEDKANAKTFTYTFAAPNTTYENTSNLNYATIFNFMNMDDIVCQIPCLNEGTFGKYGKTIPISIFSGTSITGGRLTDSYLSIMKDPDGYQGNDPDNIAGFVNSLKTNILKGNRAEVYEIDVEHHPDVYDSCVHDENCTDLSEADATAKLKEITNDLTSKGLISYCKLEKQEMVGEPGSYEIIRWYNPAFIMKDISNNFAEIQGLYDYSENVYNTIVEVIPLISGVYDGHIPMSYVVLATNANY